MKIDFLTLFPEMFNGVLNQSILKRAQDKNMLTVNTVDFRHFAENKHNQVDDYPFGGGQGMVLKPEPIFNAMESIEKTDDTRVILMCPQGKPFTQAIANELSQSEHVVFICGHYEGYDERIREHLVTDEISMGDFVLTGGEIPAMAVIDSVSRLKKGVLGKEESFMEESFSNGLLEYPQYTRPPVFMGRSVPDILLSGHHKNIDTWRHRQSLIRTMEKRPDILKSIQLNKDDKEFIEAYKSCTDTNFK